MFRYGLVYEIGVVYRHSSLWGYFWGISGVLRMRQGRSKSAILPYSTEVRVRIPIGAVVSGRPKYVINPTNQSMDRANFAE